MGAGPGHGREGDRLGEGGEEEKGRKNFKKSVWGEAYYLFHYYYHYLYKITLKKRKGGIDTTL